MNQFSYKSSAQLIAELNTAEKRKSFTVNHIAIASVLNGRKKLPERFKNWLPPKETWNGYPQQDEKKYVEVMDLGDTSENETNNSDISFAVKKFIEKDTDESKRYEEKLAELENPEKAKNKLHQQITNDFCADVSANGFTFHVGDTVSFMKGHVRANQKLVTGVIQEFVKYNYKKNGIYAKIKINGENTVTCLKSPNKLRPYELYAEMLNTLRENANQNTVSVTDVTAN